MPTDRSLQQRVDDRRFGQVDVAELLDAMTVAGLSLKFGGPTITTIYAEPLGFWRQGDPRPSLADDDPAVMQAIGRCAAHRSRAPQGYRLPGGVHPGPCGWCIFPLEELLAACDWATWTSRYLLSEYATWWGAEGSSYSRESRSYEYTNPRWRDFWALSTGERAHRIVQAQTP